MAATLPISYYNTFLAKKTGFISTPSGAADPDDPYVGVFPSIWWDPKDYDSFPANCATNPLFIAERNWYIEEARIQGGYNNTTVDFGVRAYLNEDNVNQQRISNGLIYSGVFNSRTGFNQTNVFSVGEDITRSVDPTYGSIQKLYTTDNDLTIFQEDKINRALIDKDAIYSAEGQGQAVTTNNLVIGQVVPYVGDFGISKNPESFANFGFRRYCADKDRGTVLRLSRDGITEIAEYGMDDFFRDQCAVLTDEWKYYYVDNTTTGVPSPNPTTTITLDSAPTDIEFGMTIIVNSINTGAYVIDISGNVVTLSQAVTIPASPAVVPLQFYKRVKDYIDGAWDIYNKQYTLSLKQALTSPTQEEEFSFYDTNNSGDESIKNTSTLSYDETVRGWPSFYTYRPTSMISNVDSFYTFYNGKIWKQHTDTGDYSNRGYFYGSYYNASITFVVNQNPSTKKVFQTVNYEGDNGYEITRFVSDQTRVYANVPRGVPPAYSVGNFYEDKIVSIKSYDEGYYTDNQGYAFRAGFNRKENLYVANLINASSQRQDGILFGAQMSGIKGYFATVKIQTDSSTNKGGLKELWTVGTKFVQSS